MIKDLSIYNLLLVFMITNLPSLVPSPHPAFHRLQYRKGMESWATGPGNEAKSANTVSKILVAKLYPFKILHYIYTLTQHTR